MKSLNPKKLEELKNNRCNANTAARKNPFLSNANIAKGYSAQNIDYQKTITAQ
jgi:hypothetical protein